MIQISHQYTYKPILSWVYICACVFIYIHIYTLYIYTYTHSIHTHIYILYIHIYTFLCKCHKNEIKYLSSQGMLYTNIYSFCSYNVLQLCNISWFRSNSVHMIICDLHNNEIGQVTLHFSL